MESAGFSGNTRQCLICESQTKSAHMGIDVCRACSIFYRRTKEKQKQYACRSGTGKCKIDREEGLTCKRCRFERFTAILEGSQVDSSSKSIISNEIVKIEISSSIPSSPNLNSDLKLDNDHNVLYPSQSLPYPFSPISNGPSSVFSDSNPHSTTDHVDHNLINRIRQSYSLLSMVRRISELSTRKTTFNPIAAANGEIPFVPATYGACNQATRICVTALFDFAASAFDDFATLDPDNKWLLVKNFYLIFSYLEASHRVIKLFPHKETMWLKGYTYYMDLDTIDKFFVDCPSQRNVEEAATVMRPSMEEKNRLGKEALKRLNPTDDEFMGLLGLAFWNIDSTPASDYLLRMAEKYRSRILHELHVTYKQESIQTQYATRLGELFFLLMTFQKCAAEIPETLELCRLLDVISDDLLIYQMQKT